LVFDALAELCCGRSASEGRQTAVCLDRCDQPSVELPHDLEQGWIANPRSDPTRRPQPLAVNPYFDFWRHDGRLPFFDPGDLR
jgi:hypothetical protein